MQHAVKNESMSMRGRGDCYRGLSLDSAAWREAIAQSTFSLDFRLWAPVHLTAKLPSSFLAYMEVQPRFADLDDTGHMDQLLLPTLGYQLTEYLSIWQGYTWVGNFNQRHTPPQSPFFEESRIYQQVLYMRKFESVKISSRTRLEERWMQHVDGTAVRFRTQLRATYPLAMAIGMGTGRRR